MLNLSLGFLHDNMLSSTVFVVDVSHYMRQPAQSSREVRDAGTLSSSSKLEIASQCVQTICQFLTNHLPWETVTLYTFSETYRLVFPPGVPQSLRDSISSISIPEPISHEEVLPSSEHASRLLALLGAVREGSRKCPKNTAVFVFTDLIRDDKVMKLIRSYPEKYQSEMFLPAHPTMPVAVIDLCEKEWPQGTSDSLLKFLVENHQTTKRYAVDPTNLKPLCDKLSKMVYAPWKGFLDSVSGSKECVCIFPNPWGLRGVRQHEKAPGTVRVTKCVDDASVRANCGWILPVQAVPELWHTPNGCDPNVPITRETRCWHLAGKSSWKPSYEKLSKNFAVGKRRACGGTLLGAAGVQVTSPENIGLRGTILATVCQAVGNWVIALDYDKGPGGQPRPHGKSERKRACDVPVVANAAAKRQCARDEGLETVKCDRSDSTRMPVEAAASDRGNADTVLSLQPDHTPAPSQGPRPSDRPSPPLDRIFAKAATSPQLAAAKIDVSVISLPEEHSGMQPLAASTPVKECGSPTRTSFATKTSAATLLATPQQGTSTKAQISPLSPREECKGMPLLPASTPVSELAPRGQLSPRACPMVNARPATTQRSTSTNKQNVPASPPEECKGLQASLPSAEAGSAKPRKPRALVAPLLRPPQQPEAIRIEMWTPASPSPSPPPLSLVSKGTVPATSPSSDLSRASKQRLVYPAPGTVPGRKLLAEADKEPAQPLSPTDTRSRDGLPFGSSASTSAEKLAQSSIFSGFPDQIPSADLLKDGFKLGSKRARRFGLIRNDDADEKPGRAAFFVEGFKRGFQMADISQMLKCGGIRTARCRCIRQMDNVDETVSARVSIMEEDVKILLGYATRRLTLFRWCKEETKLKVVRQPPQVNRPEAVLVTVAPTANQVESTKTVEGEVQLNTPQISCTKVPAAGTAAATAVKPPKTAAMERQPSDSRARRETMPPVAVGVPAKQAEPAKTAETKSQSDSQRKRREPVTADDTAAAKAVEPTDTVEGKRQCRTLGKAPETAPAPLKRVECIRTTERKRQRGIQTMQPEILLPPVSSESSPFHHALPMPHPAQYSRMPYMNYAPPAPFVPHGRPFVLNPMLFNPFWRPPGPFF